MKTILNERDTVQWSQLFLKLDFFNAYSSYLKIDILTNEVEAQKSSKGFCESWIRKLIDIFEKNENDKDGNTLSANINLHPWMNPVETEDLRYDHALSYYFGLCFKKRKGD